jgi:hypothetical protein
MHVRALKGQEMRKHFGAAVAVLAISGCASNAPSSADVAQVETAAAQAESAADTSCPTAALEVHAWAKKAREALTLRDANLLKLAADGMANAARICKQEQDNRRFFAFDLGVVEQLKRAGSASLFGQAFIRQRGGDVVTCAGESVALMAGTPYVGQAVAAERLAASLPSDVALTFRWIYNPRHHVRRWWALCVQGYRSWQRHRHVNMGGTVKAVRRSDGSRGKGRRVPMRHGFGPEGAQCRSGDEVALNVEGVVDGGVQTEEALRRSRRLEALHLRSRRRTT